MPPSTASSAGRISRAPNAASATTAMPAYAKDLRKESGKTIIAASEMATVAALNATVRPAVATLRTTASWGRSPPRISSRNRDRMNRL